MFKYERIRKVDYWIFLVIIFNVICGGAAVYASVPTFRVPAIIGFSLGLWFTSNKMRRDYSPGRARFHVFAVIIMSLLFAWLVYVVTN
ncbi:hypothetical protein BH10PAT3_BH10PAT3_3780 [soil metagenome]